MKELVLFTPYFKAQTPERQSEFDYCLRKNLDCADIARIVLLVDDGHRPPIHDPRILVIAIEGRPTYRQWAQLSATYASNAISILANTDIHFDESVRGLRQTLADAQRFVALSRFDKVGDQFTPHPNPRWSQDVWAYRTTSPLQPGLLKALDIPLGVPRCDNKVAYVFAVYGWQVCNPCQFVRTVHVHETQQRAYDKKADLTVLGGVAYVRPAETLTAPSKIEIDVWAKNADAITEVLLNRSLDNWHRESSSAAQVNGAGTTAPSPVGAPAAGSSESHLPADVRRRFMSAGRLIFEHDKRFCAYELDGAVLAIDWRNPQDARLQRISGEAAPTIHALAALVPPVLPLGRLTIRERPTSRDDCHFWQYPCSTEKQALDNHLTIPAGGNVDSKRNIVHTYLGLPWATYIDKKNYPAEVEATLAPRISTLRKLAERAGFRLAVHTVCQQIHWKRFASHFTSLGITNLHLSHATKALYPNTCNWSFQIHGWPLIAPNIEVKERRHGLHDRRFLDRRYLATFIGAHMKHYASAVRLELLEASRREASADILVEVGTEWHFNNVVYKEQVSLRNLERDEIDKERLATRRYNEILSESRFSLCPEGAGPNTLRLWESLAVGAIPVVISDEWQAPSGPAQNPDLLQNSCVVVPASEISRTFATLRELPESRALQMHESARVAYAYFRQLKTFANN